ncbi:hypothetical protein [Streptomyces phytophilus]|uniref:hypothetical protein n=1 Tax=Streptomyces phytophilus TaxID=722715 RepID=UPI0015EFFDE2|nr:hypothetical protein [Streptomyces phytophilus]
MSATTRIVNLVKAACNWCELPATFQVYANGWNDFACAEDARRYFPETFEVPEVEHTQHA